MDGVNRLNYVTFTTGGVPYNVPDLRWAIVGVTDVNSDGLPDLVWRHLQSGEVGFWPMNGTERSTYLSFGYGPFI
jgi:hypothetical protein